MNGIANQCDFKPCYKQNDLRSWLFLWFLLVTMSAHTHTYCYCLFESEMETGLQTLMFKADYSCNDS